MPIHRLFERTPFGPDEITIIVSAYEDVLKSLSLADRSDPVTLMVAQMVIEVAQTGVRDAAVIYQAVMDRLRPG